MSAVTLDSSTRIEVAAQLRQLAARLDSGHYDTVSWEESRGYRKEYSANGPVFQDDGSAAVHIVLKANPT